MADDETLIEAARTRPRACASRRFRSSRSGPRWRPRTARIITGCNIENATYSLTICAERVAMFKALSEGHLRFTRIAIVANTEQPTPPCGACSQILWEFGGELEVLLANLNAPRGRYQLRDLLPLPFDARLLR